MVDRFLGKLITKVMVELSLTNLFLAMDEVKELMDLPEALEVIDAGCLALDRRGVTSTQQSVRKKTFFSVILPRRRLPRRTEISL